MPVAVTIEGKGLQDLSRKMKALNRKDLVRELNKGLREAAAPAIPVARNAARASLPSSGGLADRIANAPMKIVASPGARTPSVKIKVKGVDVKSTERGRLRHPVFGNREVWVTQQIKPGWFTDAMREHAQSPRVRVSMVQALKRFSDKAARA